MIGCTSGTVPASRPKENVMTARSPIASQATDDYTYEMQVRVPLAQINAALTDGAVIAQWWTAVSGSERDGDEVRLFMGDHAPFIAFTVDQTPETGAVVWTVTDCAVMRDW